MNILIIGGDKKRSRAVFALKTGKGVNVWFRKYEYLNEIVSAENLVEAILSAQATLPLAGIEAEKFMLIFKKKFL